MRHSKWRWPKRIGLLAVALAALGVGERAPRSAAASWRPMPCPACYGLERVTSTLYVEAAMPEQDRAKLRDTIAGAQAQVAGFYELFRGPPHPARLRDRSLRPQARRTRRPRDHLHDIRRKLHPGRPARLEPDHPFPRVFACRTAPAHRGLEALLGRGACMVDEGVAVIVSDDGRHLKPGAEGRATVHGAAGRPLPGQAISCGVQRRAKIQPFMLRPARVRCSSGWMRTRGGPAGLLHCEDRQWRTHAAVTLRYFRLWPQAEGSAIILKTAVELASMRGCPAKQHAASFPLHLPGRKAAETPPRASFPRRSV